MLVRDDFSRYSWVYLLQHKSEAADAFETFLADTRTDGSVEIVRSDNGGEFRGRFSELCVKNRIKQELTTPQCPELNGVAERGTAVIESTRKAARLHASTRFRGTGAKLPAPTENLWDEATNLACDAINRTATSANVGHRSPYELWHGHTASFQLLPFLKPGFVHKQPAQKHPAKAVPCLYLGPAHNHPRDVVRVLTDNSRNIRISRDVTWPAVPARVPPIQEGGGSHLTCPWRQIPLLVTTTTTKRRSPRLLRKANLTRARTKRTRTT